MKTLSTILRLLSGLAVMAMAARVYIHNHDQFDTGATGTVTVLGKEMAISGGTALTMVCAFAAVGLLMVVLAIVSLIRRRRTP